MDQNRSSGLLGLLGIAGCVAAYFVLRQRFPALATVLLWIFGILAALIVLLVAVVLYAAFHKPKLSPEQEKAKAREAVLKQARVSLMELRTASMRVRDQQIRTDAGQICAVLEKILRTLQDQPEDLPKARRFLNQSLPMLSGILGKYARLEQSGIPNEAVTAQTTACLQELQRAARKQYDSLFDNDVVDITADMDVLIQLCRQSGLLEEEIKLPEPLELT